MYTHKYTHRIYTCTCTHHVDFQHEYIYSIYFIDGRMDRKIIRRKGRKGEGGRKREEGEREQERKRERKGERRRKKKKERKSVIEVSVHWR